MIKIKQSIQKAQNLPAKQRLWLVYFLTICSTVFCGWLWLRSYSGQLSELHNKPEGSSFSMPNLPPISMPDLDIFNQLAAPGIKDGQSVSEFQGTNDVIKHIETTIEQYIQNNEIFKDSSFSELRISDNNESGIMESLKQSGDLVIILDHFYKGLLVSNSNVKLYFNLINGELIKVEPNIKSDIVLDTNIQVVAQVAVEKAKQHLKDDSLVFRQSSLIVVVVNKQAYVAWDILFTKSDSGEETERILVEAKKGQIFLWTQID